MSMPHWCFPSFLILSWLLIGSAGEAKQPTAPATPVDELLAHAADALPAPEPAMQSAHERLQSSVTQLKSFLAGTGGQKDQLWRDWLALANLETELARPSLDFSALARHLERYSQDQPGLELPPLVVVRGELKHALAASEYATAADPRQFARDRLSELSACLAQLDQRFNPQAAAKAGHLLGWLEALGGESAAVAGNLRTRYSSTNGVIQGSARLINHLLQRSVSDQRFIADEILGSYTQGVALTQAQVSFGFVPSREHATLDIRMQGLTTFPSNVAQRRRISVYTSGTTAINADKRVNLNEEGLQLAPAVASAATNMQINDIEAGRRLVERMAWRRVERMTPDAESLASQRAQVEASSKLDQQAASALAGANEMFREKIRAPLIRHDAFPSLFRFESDYLHMLISLVQQNERQLAVATPVPQLPTNYDVAVAAHESMIINLTESLLGGATIKDQTWLELVKLLMGDEPRPLWVHDRAERWRVTLSRDLPLIAHFDGDRVCFTLRLIKLTRGNEEFRHAIEVDVRFAPEQTRDVPMLAREGNVTVRFGDEVDSEQAEKNREFLRRKFDAVFPAEMYFYGLMPPDGGMLSKLNDLQLKEFKSAAGWLSVGYELKPATSDTGLVASRERDSR